MRAAAYAQLRELNRYPERFPGRLIARLADVHRVPRSHVGTGCGSVAVAAHLVQAHARSGDEVVFPWRSFDAYPRLARTCGATGVPVPLLEGRQDLAAVLAAITPRTRVVFVCNPNNPTGTAVRGEALRPFLDAVPESVLVILDEAYRDFVTDPQVPDGLELYRQRSNVAVLRTFSKAHGLAALRVGYSIAPEPVTSAARDCTIPFGVSAAAEAAALAALEDPGAVQAQVRVLVAERDRLLAGLRAIGLAVPPSQANFLWLPLGDATGVFERVCADHGLQVRAFPGEGVRVSIGTLPVNDLVLRLAAHTVRCGTGLPGACDRPGPAAGAGAG